MKTLLVQHFSGELKMGKLWCESRHVELLNHYYTDLGLSGCCGSGYKTMKMSSIILIRQAYVSRDYQK